MTGNALRAAAPYVQLDAVLWLPETASHDTPESLLLDRESEEDDDATDARDDAVLRELASEKLAECLALIPEREALAMTLALGLAGYPATMQGDVAGYVCANSQQAVSYMVRRARARLLYLASRPAVDFEVLSRHLSPSKLEVVRAVFETTSFTEVARRRWPCPGGRDPRQRHVWTRNRAQNVKRDFFRALAKVERRPELVEQAAALRHLVEHLGMLSHHTGKGRRPRGERLLPTAEVAGKVAA